MKSLNKQQPMESFLGTVLRSTGSWYEVLHEGECYQCRIRGKLRLKGIRSTNPVVVGDVVRVEEDEQGGYVISAIEPRRNYIIRRASNLSKESHIIAANIDMALLGVTLFSALFVCVGNMIANLLYGIVDPQIREVSE